MTHPLLRPAAALAAVLFAAFMWQATLAIPVSGSTEIVMPLIA